jgi:hypothetical protein
MLYCDADHHGQGRIRAVGLEDCRFCCCTSSGDYISQSFAVANCAESGIDDFYFLGGDMKLREREGGWYRGQMDDGDKIELWKNGFLSSFHEYTIFSGIAMDLANNVVCIQVWERTYLLSDST